MYRPCIRTRGMVSVAVGVLIGIVICGVGIASAGADSSAATRIGVSLTNFSPYYVVIYNNIKTEQQKSGGGSVLQPAINGFDAGKQVTDIRNLITAGADTLYVVPANNKALGPALSYAGSRKIPVVVIDDQVQTGKVYVNVRADNVLMADKACRAMGKFLKGEGKVLSLMGDQATTNGRDRTVGFNRCMKLRYPNIEVISRPTQWNTTKAADAIQAVLTANPDLGGIYLQSETLFLAPAVSILKAKGLTAKAGQPGHVVLVGIDGTPQMLKAIRAETADAVVSQPIPDYAKWGVKYLEMAKTGKKLKLGKTSHGSTIVRAPGGNVTDLLSAPLVTKANVGDPSLWGNQAK